MLKSAKFYVILFLLFIVFLIPACRQDDEAAPEEVGDAASASVETEAAEPQQPAEPTQPVEPTDVPPTAQPQPTATAEPEVAVDPADIDWPPQVVASDPLPGAEVDIDSPIALRFDQPMDQASVEEAWAMEPAVSGAFEWPRPDTVVFKPQKDLQREQIYKIQVAHSAQSANGLTLQESIQLELMTSGSLVITQVIPEDGTKDVQTDGAITVVFNRPVVPLVSNDQQASLPQPLSIEPAVAGEGEWVSTSIYRYEPGPSGFAGATSYNVSVDENLTDFSGAPLGESYAWQFTTQNPSVVMIQPPNNATLVSPTRPISVTFNMPMDRGSTQSAVSLVPAANLSFDWQDDDRLLILRPEESLDLETTYDLTISQGAKSATGQAGLDREFASRFKTVPYPAVIGSNPSNGAVVDPWQRGVSFQFASSMDPETLEDHIRIEPEPETVRIYYNEYIDEINPSYSNFNLYLDFHIEGNTDYTVTIPGTAADLYGNTLEEDFVLNFSMGGFTPVASFNLPSGISQLSTSFPSEVEIIHRNVSRLDVSLHELPAPLNSVGDYSPYRDDFVLPEPIRSWSVSTDTAQDEAGLTTIALADGGVLPTGAYVVTVDAPELGDSSRYWANRTVVLFIADTNLVVNQMPDAIHVWATDLESGQPTPNRNVTLYEADGSEIGTAVSDNSGFARLEHPRNDEYWRGLMAISGTAGSAGFGAGSTSWTSDINLWKMGIYTGRGSNASLYAYIYTDRPIYRPGDTVHFKGILRESDYGRYYLPEPQTIELTISTNFYDPSSEGSEQTVVVEANEEGIFYGEYVIPEEITLGSYQIYAEDYRIDARRTFTIAEYRAPEFQVILEPEKPEALRGEAVDVFLEATYFFGGSAAGLEVNWSLYDQSFRPDVSGPHYAFGDQANYYYQDPGLFGGFGGGEFGNYLDGGSGTTDENGLLTITIPADILQDAAEGSRKVQVEATVNDISNFPVTASTTVNFHSADVYVGLRPTEFGPIAGTESTVDLLTVDWDGEAVGSQNVEVVFYRREWEPTRTTDYGVYYTFWEAIDTEVARTSLTTDAGGKAQASFIPDDGGTYIAVATVTDNAGRTQTSSTSIWVIDQNYAGWRADPKEKFMALVPDKDTYRVGETARILVPSPFNEAVQAWMIIERGNMIEQRVVTLEGGSAVVDLPIKPDYAPNVFVTITAIKPVNRLDETNPYADIRLGIAELQVDPEQFHLNVQLTPRENFFEPRDTAVYDILITDNDGNPVAGDFSLALVDLAVLSLKDDNAEPILEAFYSPVLYYSEIGSGLFISGEGLEPEIPLEGGGLGGGGGDEAAAEAVAKLESDEDETRRDFPDTAYWEASVQTGADGRATVEIPLPDSLTTWRLSSKAVTNDTKVGQSSTDVIVTLPLLIRPVTPRFFTVADVVQLGGIINNNTDTAVDATASLQVDGLVLSGDAAQEVRVPAGGSQLVRWEVTVEDVPYADLTFRVEGGGYKDATKPTLGVGPDNQIPVFRYDAQDFSGTSGELDGAGRQVEAVLLPPEVDIRQGSVDMQLNPSLAAAILDALTVAEKKDYDPSCAHTITNRLFPNIAVFQTIENLGLDMAEFSSRLDEQVPADISALEDLQMRGGGWGWCSAEESDPWLSAYAVLALAKAEANGFIVNKLVLDRGQDYVGEQLVPMGNIDFSWDANRQAFFIYVLAEAGQSVTDLADDLVESHRDLLDPYARALLILAYEASSGGADNQQTLLADLNDEAVISASGAHWEDAEQDFFNLSSNIRGTAMVINALAQADPESVFLPHAVRWLMIARTAEVWSTAHETAWSIFALSDYMVISDELAADYAYQVDVNGVPYTDGQFSAENITESVTLSVPIQNLLEEETNFFDYQRGDGGGRLYYTMYLNSFVDAGSVDAASHGLTVARTYYAAACDPEVDNCEPIEAIAAGQEVRVVLDILVPNDLVYAVIEDPIPSGAEGIDPNLNTSASGFGSSVERTDADYLFGYWGFWFFNKVEYRDEKVVFRAINLPAGTYQYTYYLQPLIPGEYQVMPATGYQEFFPDIFGRSDGMILTITGE